MMQNVYDKNIKSSFINDILKSQLIYKKNRK